MEDLTREFLIESQEGLDRMERCLTDLEARPGDGALLAEIFRAVHTIKGTTGFLGFKRLEKLAHAGENLLGLLRDGKRTADAPVITGLLQLPDGLRSILRSIETTGDEGEDRDAELIGRLEELQKPPAPTAPQSELTRKRSRSTRPRKLSATPRSRKQVSTVPVVSPVTVIEPVDTPPLPAPGPQARAAIEAVGPPATPGNPAAIPSTAASASASLPSASAAESTLRVDIGLLNRMMNLVGELVLTRNQVLQATASDPKMTQLSRRLDMVTADLREAVMKARMQPVSHLFSKMPRLVRDLSQKLSKRVRLEMEGQDTELDKSLLEAIKDPLTHAVRNALDHGIEPSAVRQAAGKAPEGVLRLRAVQQGSHVLVEVTDDGAGIAVEKIRDKAVERGLISAQRAAQQSERELLQLVFLPGFSTAAAVTSVSGRGVGMDVVRTNVEKIGGKVEIDSRSGKGTTLRLRIPLTLAIIPALIVRSGGESFALPQSALSELVHIAPAGGANSIEWIEDAPLYRLRGMLLPLVFLDRLLAPEKAAIRDPARAGFIAVLDADGRRYGLVVDGLADPEEIVVKPLSAALKGIGFYSGATVLGNGELALILDPGAIALKAGISMSSGDEMAHASEDRTSATAAGGEFLLVEAGGRNAAVPLDAILRIEQLPLSQLEFIGNQPVLHFEGSLLPVDDSAGVLGSAGGDPDGRFVVVVCRDGERQVAIAVSHVLDVVQGANLAEAGTGRPAAGQTLLKNRVTGIVELGRISSIARGEPMEFAEAVQ